MDSREHADIEYDFMTSAKPPLFEAVGLVWIEDWEEDEEPPEHLREID